MFTLLKEADTTGEEGDDFKKIKAAPSGKSETAFHSKVPDYFFFEPANLNSVRSQRDIDHGTVAFYALLFSQIGETIMFPAHCSSVAVKADLGNTRVGSPVAIGQHQLQITPLIRYSRIGNVDSQFITRSEDTFGHLYP